MTKWEWSTLKNSSQNPACRVGGHLGRVVGTKFLTVMGKGQMETCLELWQFNKLYLTKHFEDYWGLGFPLLSKNVVHNYFSLGRLNEYFPFFRTVPPVLDAMQGENFFFLVLTLSFFIRSMDSGLLSPKIFRYC